MFLHPFALVNFYFPPVLGFEGVEGGLAGGLFPRFGPEGLPVLLGPLGGLTLVFDILFWVLGFPTLWLSVLPP